MVIAGAVVLFGSARFPAQQEADIRGTVVDLESGQPVQNALIVLSGDAGYFRVNSDVAGRFVVEGMAAGDYRAQVTRDGYFWSKGRSGPATVTVTAAQDLRSLSFRLLNASAISGRIVNEHGDPDAGISVAALRLEYRNGMRVLNPVFPTGWSRTSASTDRRGEYRLYGLEPGQYYIRVASGRSATYYPGTMDPNLAVPITVPPGRDLTGVNLTLLRAPMYTVTVTVDAPSSVSLGTTSLALGTIRPRDPARLVDLSNSSGSPFSPIGGGRYRSYPLLPGEYEVTWFALSATRLYGGVAFDITDRDIDAGTITLHPGIALSGRIRMAESRSELKALSMVLNPYNSAPTGNGASTSSDGSFTIPSVPEGQYWLELRTMPRDVYVQSVRHGARVQDHGDISVGRESEGPLEVVLATGGSVTGTVRNARGEVVPYSAVLIYPSGGQQHPSFFRTTVADKNGSFATFAMAPQEYRVLAWEDSLPPLYLDPTFLRELVPRATRVTVQSGSAAAIEVRVVP